MTIDAKPGIIWESDKFDPAAPVASGSPPPFEYKCAAVDCFTMIAPNHKYWPLCTRHYYNKPADREIPV